MNHNNKHIGSGLLACAGTLMMISSVLMAICSTVAVGIIFGASGFCMLIAAHNFRVAEKKKESDDEDQN